MVVSIVGKEEIACDEHFLSPTMFSFIHYLTVLKTTEASSSKCRVALGSQWLNASCFYSVNPFPNDKF